MSEHSGMSIKSAQKLYEHVFINEYELMNHYGKDSITAHELTCRKYNYGVALKSWLEKKD